MTPLVVIIIYMALLLGLGLVSKMSFRGTSKDYFVASHSIGPFLLLMSVFGTTMTAFALVGSTGKSFERGIGVYGLMASSSGLVHAACFFLIGMKLWVFGKRYGYVTQIQYFRARFESNGLGYLLFPILVGFVIPYLLIGVIGAGKTVLPATAGAFPDLFPNAATPQWAGGIPAWLTGLVVCGVVLAYVFAGGSRAAAWANTFQTIVFMVMGVLAFYLISGSLGGLSEAGKVTMRAENGKLVQPYRFDPKTKKLVPNTPPKVVGLVKAEGDHAVPANPHLSRTVVTATHKRINPKTHKPVLGKDGKPVTWKRELGVPPWMFFSYLFIPLSVGMFPHLFQHWLTAKSVKTFRLTLIAHPLFIMVVWVPCVLLGAWASGIAPPGVPSPAVLGYMVKTLVGSPILVGLVTAGVMAAIMSSLDSQFHCMGTIFTNDIVLHRATKGKYTDKQIVWMARAFTIGIVALTYVIAMWAGAQKGVSVFDLAVWCFTGFSALTPIVIAALYWKRATKAGAFASVIAVLATWGVLFVVASVQNHALGGEYTLPGGIMPVMPCVLVGAVTMVVVSLMTKPPSDETLRKFFPESA